VGTSMWPVIVSEWAGSDRWLAPTNFPFDAVRLFGAIADIAADCPATCAVVPGAAHFSSSGCPFGDFPGARMFGSILLRPAGH
jgi:hypothetical protein